jgi:two-component system chemotaxis response regulator CheY
MKNILIVDDDNLIRMYLRTMVGNLDIQNIYEASNGEKAINLAEEYQPGLVLLDINLPDCDGIDLLERLHTIIPESKILMVSSEATVDRIKTAQAKGSIGFIVKPFNAEVVLQKITSALNNN